MTFFDTLAFANKLKAAGISAKVAEAHTEALREFVMSELATKADLLQLEQHLTIKLGILAVTVIGVLVALDKLL